MDNKMLKNIQNVEDELPWNKDEIQQLEKHMALRNRLVEEKYDEIFIPGADFKEELVSTVIYHIAFTTDINVGFFHKKALYLLNDKRRLSRYNDKKNITKKDKEHAFKVYTLEQIRTIEEQIKAQIKMLCDQNEVEWQEEGITFYLFMTRVGKPKYLVSREDIKKVLLTRQNKNNHTLAIDTEGYLHLIPTDEITGSYYAVRLEEDDYEDFRFSVDNIEDIYLTLLNGWKQHLEQESSQWVFRGKNDLVEEKLLMKISKLVNKI